MRERTVNLGDPVNVVDFGGDGRPIVLVHGLGGSHVNWVSVGERLAPYGRVTAVDLIGHGYTRPFGRRGGVPQNRGLLQRYLRTLDDEAVLVGNSMGGYISLTVAASTPELVRGLVLVGAALPRERIVPHDPFVAGVFALYMIPGVAQRFLRWRSERLKPEGLVEQTLKLCTVDVNRISDEAWEAHVQMARERAEMPWTSDIFLEAARSLVPRLAGRERVGKMVRAIDCPALIIQGEKDRLVPVEVARNLADHRPEWQLEIFEDIGHVPQLEAADRFVDVVGAWLEKLEVDDRVTSR